MIDRSAVDGSRSAAAGGEEAARRASEVLASARHARSLIANARELAHRLGDRRVAAMFDSKLGEADAIVAEARVRVRRAELGMRVLPPIAGRVQSSGGAV